VLSHRRRQIFSLSVEKSFAVKVQCKILEQPAVAMLRMLISGVGYRSIQCGEYGSKECS
jgi:hypothetical protein